MASSAFSHDQWPPLPAAHQSVMQPSVPTGGHAGAETATATANPGGFSQPLGDRWERKENYPVLSRPSVSPDSRLPTKPSFATAARPKQVFRFPPIHIPSKPHILKDGKPAVVFTAAELQPGIQRFQHSIVAKFSAGRPHIDDIRRCFAAAWSIEDLESIGAIDARHILIIASSDEDSNKIFAHPLRKVGQSLFRLFRWTPGFDRRKEPTTTTTWIKLPGLPNQLYDQGYLNSIVSQFSRFIAIDHRTRVVSNPSFARVCIELDLNKPIPEEIWVGLTASDGFWQPITYENKLLYCSRCKLHGHSLSNCRKAKPPSVARHPTQPTQTAARKETRPVSDPKFPPEDPKKHTEDWTVAMHNKSLSSASKVVRGDRPISMTTDPTSSNTNNKALEWTTVQKRKKGKNIVFQKNGKEQFMFNATPQDTTCPLQTTLSGPAEGENVDNPKTISSVSDDAIPGNISLEGAVVCVEYPKPVSGDNEFDDTLALVASKEGHLDHEEKSTTSALHTEDSSGSLPGHQFDSDLASAVVVFQDTNSNEDLQIPEEIVQKMRELFCEKVEDSADARAFYLHLKATCDDDRLLLQAMDEAVNRDRQAQMEGSDMPIEESDNSVDLSLILKKPRPNKKDNKGSRFS